MKYIDEEKINNLLSCADRNAGQDKINGIIAKSKSLGRLSLEEAAVLLSAEDADSVNKIFEAAAYVKQEIYGKRIVLFAPVYINNQCSNFCTYCAFKADNKAIKRKKLTPDEIKKETELLLKMGHKRVLMVSSEENNPSPGNIDYYVEAVKSIYAAEYKSNRVRRVNVNCAPLSEDDFKKLKAVGIGTYQLFQETYHRATYKKVHPAGPKSDFDNRLDAIDKAVGAGIDDVGIGVLYGLYDYKFDTLAMLTHIEYLEKKFNVGPHTISVPRLEPAVGVDLDEYRGHMVRDEDFKKLVAVLRLVVPYTGIILSTRETAKMRDELFTLGVSQISAASKTSPGGYSKTDFLEDDTQFNLSDNRSLDEVIASLIRNKVLPSFCTACYRAGRTGEKFMNMAKPGIIKGKCCQNALITFKEYLDDFASLSVREEGYKLIFEEAKNLDAAARKDVMNLLYQVSAGERDKYV